MADLSTYPISQPSVTAQAVCVRCPWDYQLSTHRGPQTRLQREDCEERCRSRPALAHRRYRHRIALSLRRKQRRSKFKTVISYLDIEEGQYTAELGKYTAVSDGSDPMLLDPIANAPGRRFRWEESVSDVSESLASMRLWDGPS